MYAFRSDCTEPTNPIARGLPKSSKEVVAPDQMSLTANVLKDMNLHRAVMCGKGFWQWMNQSGPEKLTLHGHMAQTSVTELQHLPVVNFLDFPSDKDNKLAEAVTAEVLEEDRVRFRAYMSKRSLGLGLLTAVCEYRKLDAVTGC